MNARYSAIFLALLLGSIVGVSGAWAQGFQSVYSPDGVDVWAVGDAGVCYRSFDSGTTFTNFSLGAGTLRGVFGRGFTHIVIGDAGKLWRSTDNGGTWATQTIAGTPNLRGIAMPSASIAYIVGDAGTILKSIDGGASWSPMTSGTGAQLNAVEFTDDLNGWAIGNGGVVLRTTDGANWNPVSLGTTSDLLSVDQSGQGVWIVGTRGTAFRSLNGGGNWTQIDLELDARSDVRAVCMLSTPDTVYIAGGGGFIRRSYDQGANWTFLQHTMQSPLTDLCFAGAKGYFASQTNRTVLRTSDRGTTWSLPTSATISRSWVLKKSNSPSIRGSTIFPQGQNPNTFYALLGGQVWRSRDDGETWTSIGNPIPNSSQANAFIVSPKDSNLWVAAVTGSNRHIVRTTNAGTTWTDVMTPVNFGEYGIPLEMNPDKPDTLLFGGGDDSGSDERLYRSTDFGATWAAYSNAYFRSPCDIVWVPKNNVVCVGDGVTGSGTGILWRSTDGGVTFTSIQSTSPASESPGMAGCRLRPSQLLATEWSSGGTRRTGDMGASWPVVNSTSSTWGVSIAKDDPNVVVYGQYSGGGAYVAFDGGLSSGSWTNTSLPGTNYTFWAKDRATLLSLQQAGIYKMNVTSAYTPTNTQAITVTAPNGGEVWGAGSQHNVTWTGQNIGLARIEYRRSAVDPWIQVADVAGYLGTYSWTIPCNPTTTAQVRVYDAWDVNPVDLSNSTFTISGATAASNPPSVDFGTETVGNCITQAVTVQNTGNTTLNVTTFVAGAPYHVGRSAFSVGPGLSDTVGVTFCPGAQGTFLDTLLIQTNGCAGAGSANLLVPIVGNSIPAGSIDVPLANVDWEWNTQQSIGWTSNNVQDVGIDYRIAPAAPWNAIVPSVPASQGSYLWTIPNAPTDSAQVRVKDVASAIEDISGFFRIIVPAIAATPNPLELGSVFPGEVSGGELTITNPGTATLVITNVTVGDPEFWPGRTALSVPAGGSDTLGVFYSPTAVGPDTTNLTIYSVDPTSPHNFTLISSGKGTVGVGDPIPVSFAAWQNQPRPRFATHCRSKRRST
jgi:photosystem II stability/assembly factor-like uncharacterized protein